MDLETNFDDTPTAIALQRRDALNHAAAVGCGVVRVIDGKTERTFANTWVEPGKEITLDLRQK